MAGPTHDAEVLAAWQSGETRMVYARHKSDPNGPLYYLVDGTAKPIRPWAKAHLECPVPGCPQPALTTVSRSTRRDGFKHGVGAGGHGVEGLSHLQGKALIARWVADRYPEVRVEPEAATPSKARRADVMLSWPSGQQVAIEIQYAGLTVGAWTERHESYRAQGIVDVWLLGHVPPHLRRAKRRSWEADGTVDGQVSLTVLHHAILAAGLPLLWIHPEREELGVSWQECQPDDHYARDPDGLDDTTWAVPPQPDDYGDARARFRAVPLAACHLSADGLAVPGYDTLLRNAAQLSMINAEQDRRAAAREAAEGARHEKKAAEEAQRRALAEAQREALRQRRMADAERHHARQPGWEREWLDADLRKQVVARYGGIPHVIAAKVGPIEGVLAYPEEWHSVLYGHLILGRKPGDRWTIREACQVLRARGITLHSEDKALVGETVAAYVRHLATSGLVRLGQASHKRYIQWAEVVGTIEDVERWHEEAAEERRLRTVDKERATREAEARWREQMAYAKARAEERAAAAANQPVPQAAVPLSAPRTDLRCRKCRWPLDERFAEEGLHLLC